MTAAQSPGSRPGAGSDHAPDPPAGYAGTAAGADVAQARSHSGTHTGTRGAVLAALKAAVGEYVSGAELAQQLCISRAAVSKQIAALRQEGYAIESVSRRGHRLLASPDAITVAELRAVLRTARMGQIVEYRAQVGSTNELAKAMARAGASEGTVVVAEAQTEGKGRLGRDWHSPPATGIWMSVILRPALAPRSATRLTLAAAVAVAGAIRQVAAVAVGIKWPNDIVVGSRKLCGILTEMELDEERIHFAVVGIGINVNTAADQFPPELRSVATSLAAERGEPVPRAPLAAAVLARLEEAYTALLNGEFDRIRNDWRAASVTLGRWVRILPAAGGGEALTGLAEEVDADGALLVRLPDGTLTRVVAGEVSVRPLTEGAAGPG